MLRLCEFLYPTCAQIDVADRSFFLLVLFDVPEEIRVDFAMVTCFIFCFFHRVICRVSVPPMSTPP